MTGSVRSDTLGFLKHRLEPHGLTLRGGLLFADDAPVLRDGRRMTSLLLIGYVGSSLWPAFSRFRRNHEGPDPLDHWSKQVIDPIAEAAESVALYPFDKPWWPFQQWITASEGLERSPLGILIHPEYGLWHGYRAALAFDRPIEVPQTAFRPHPCDSCDDKPCLTTCPANAVTEASFNLPSCRRYLASSEGQGGCMVSGCAARIACPVGQNFRYDPAHMQFHMQALDLPEA